MMEGRIRRNVMQVHGRSTPTPGLRQTQAERKKAKLDKR
jgi:hypothetical protein